MKFSVVIVSFAIVFTGLFTPLVQAQNINSIVYESKELLIRQVSQHSFEHTSYLETESFGRVASNGLVLAKDHEAVIFDTPATPASSEELIDYLTRKGYVIKAIIATHFHEDCVGGLGEFHARKIPSYAHCRTIELLKRSSGIKAIPQQGFQDTLRLSVGNKAVYAAYFGEGHTKDNTIGYFPEDKLLFGGCLIKEMGAGKGNLEDANVNAWSATVKRIREKYPQIQIVIPGHGKRGGAELLDYTITLFR